MNDQSNTEKARAVYNAAVTEFYELEQLYTASKARVIEAYNALCEAMEQPGAKIADGHKIIEFPNPANFADLRANLKKVGVGFVLIGQPVTFDDGSIDLDFLAISDEDVVPPTEEVNALSHYMTYGIWPEGYTPTDEQRSAFED